MYIAKIDDVAFDFEGFRLKHFADLGYDIYTSEGEKIKDIDKEINKLEELGIEQEE